MGGRFRPSGSGGANAAIRNVRRVQRGGGRSPAKARHAERPSPGPSRRAGGERNAPEHESCIEHPGIVPSFATRNRRPPGKCHEMSCFVMIRMHRVHILVPVLAWLCPSGRGLRVFRPAPGPVCLRHQVLPFDPVPLPLQARGGSHFRAYRARAGGRVGAGAVRVPDCARETADARLPSVPLGFFRAGAKQETERPADAASS